MNDIYDSKDEQANQRSQRTADRQTLLTQRLQKALQADARLYDIPRLPQDEPKLLSYAQQRLWFLDQLMPGNCLYTIPLLLTFTGVLNIDALTSSLEKLLQRHEALRTTFATIEGELQQVIAPAQPLVLPVVDLAGPEQETLKQHVIDEEIRRPFDLTRDSLFRALLLCWSDTQHFLLLTIHHIVFDGWSKDILLKELAAYYEAFVSGQPAGLADLPIQYSDYAGWQRSWLQGERLQKQLTYWKEQLAGAPGLLELAADRPRPAQPAFQGASQHFTLSDSLLEKLQALSRSAGVTLFMTLLAAFQTLLYHYSGQEDIVVGTPVAGRVREATEGIIGLFVNTLALRTSLKENPPFRLLLDRVRRTASGAFAHQDLPFERLVEEIGGARSLSHHPVFQVMFILQQAAPGELTLPDLTLSLAELGTGTAKFDLTFELYESAGALSGRVEYNTALFEISTIKRMVTHWQRILEGCVADPEQRLSDFQLLSEAEQQQLLSTWAQSAQPFPQHFCLHQLIEAQVRRTPEAIALVCEDERISYRELDKKANQLAHYLQQHGVGPEVLVGIFMERSLEMVIALLAVLKAGGAYLPLDRAYPQQRLEFMIEDARAKIILTQQRMSQDVPGLPVSLICVDTEWEDIARESEQAPTSEVTAINSAYVIYTSGSTGQPKGAQIEHRGLINYLTWAMGAYESAHAGTFPLYSSLAFDLTVTSLYLPLLTGNTLFILSPHLSGVDLIAALARVHTFQSAKFTPAHLELLIQDAKQHGPGMHALRHVIVGGEALPVELVKSWFAYYPQTILYNEYGPTETTVGCIMQKITSSETFCDWQTIPIGHPIANTRIFILDGEKQMVPIGVKGEIYIGGAGVARGYLHRPELTAERFLELPFSPGERVYRTGDIGLYRDDGVIEYYGRTDQQIKIRGFRIELGEIEAALRVHSAIRECVVIAQEEKLQGKRLIAYIVPEQEQSLSVSDMRPFLLKSLPDFMVPAAFIILKTLPLTAHGKIDRSALPAPEQEASTREEVFAGPRTPTEEVLTSIWLEVLHIKRIGIHDNFFAAGGHSLLAMQITSRIHEKFQVEIPLRSLFEAPTIAELSLVVTHALHAPPRESSQEPPQTKRWSPGHLLERLDQLSEDEVETLLTALLEANEEGDE